MADIKLNQLDYRFILVDSYKELGLNENELAVLLVCDNLLREESVLITREILTLKMCLPMNELDELLVELFNKGYLEYDSSSKTIVTSIKPMYVKLANHFSNSLINEKIIQNNEDTQAAIENIFGRFQKVLGRSLAPVEYEKIKEWVASGIDEEVIINSLDECASKTVKVTIKAVDKMILKNLKSTDIKNEGYSPVSEKWEKDINKSIEIASRDWIK